MVNLGVDPQKLNSKQDSCLEIAVKNPNVTIDVVKLVAKL